MNNTTIRSSLLTLVVFALLTSGCGKKILPGPDLTFSDAPTPTPAAPTTAETTHVTFTLVNSGDRDSGSFDWVAYVEDDAIATGTIASLARGATQPASIDVPGMEPGPHALSIAIDPDRSSPDRSRSNNVAAFVLTTTAAPPRYDLNFSVPPSASPASPTTATPVTVSFTIRNSDTSSTSTTAYNVHWHLFDNGAPIGNNTISSIPPGGSQLQTFMLSGSSAAAGTHHISVEIDPTHLHHESDETNNESSVDVVISAAG